MRHRKIRGRLGRTSAHRRAMINNMITSLFAHERIQTTVANAKAARRVAERMITFAKSDTLHARRLAHRRIRDKQVLQKLFAVLGPRYQERPGGYTRVIRLAPRTGDGAELAILELVGRFVARPPAGEEKPKRRRKKGAEPAEAAEPAAEAEAEPELVEETAGEPQPAEGEETPAETGAEQEPAEEAKPKKKARRRLLRRRKRSE
jgi:large subunit ribosomal protein L17